MSVVTGNAKRALPASGAGRRVRSCEFGRTRRRRLKALWQNKIHLGSANALCAGCSASAGYRGARAQALSVLLATAERPAVLARPAGHGQS